MIKGGHMLIHVELWKATKEEELIEQIELKDIDSNIAQRIMVAINNIFAMLESLK